MYQKEIIHAKCINICIYMYIHTYFNKTFNVDLHENNHPEAENLVCITLVLDEFK